MMTARLGAIATAACVLIATPALAQSYDCADYGGTPIEEMWTLSDAQEGRFMDDRTRLPDYSDFMFRHCGRIVDGRKMVMVGALHVVDDWAICDDDLNYAIFYDLETREFGEPIPHQKFCGRGMKIRRPEP